MRQPVGYYCSKCKDYHMSPGAYDMKDTEKKKYRNHKRYARNKPC